MKRILLFSILLIGAAVTAFPRDPLSPGVWTGPPTTTVGMTETYTFDNGNVYSQWEFITSKGIVVSASVDGSTHTVAVHWNQSGTGTVTFEYGAGGLVPLGGQKSVSISGPNVPDPNATFSFTSTCGSTTITRTGSAGNDLIWYWQTSANGTYQGDFGSTFTITNPGNVYLRAQQTSAPYAWSDAQSAGLVAIYTAPPAPATSTNAEIISDVAATVSLSVSAVTPSTGYKWYPVASGGGAIAGATSISYSPVVSATKDFYVETINGPCVSLTRRKVTAHVYPIPKITSDDGSVNMGSQALLKVENFAYDSYQWMNSEVNENISGATNSTFSTTTAGTFKVKVKKGSSPDYISSVYTVDKNLGDLNMNYVISSKILVEGIKSEAAVSDLMVTQKSQTIQYFDGLGSPLQSVVTQGSPLMKDIVQQTVLDGLGRESRKYLPATVNKNSGWFKSSLINSQGAYSSIAADFYSNNSTGKIAQDNRPYSETAFESSPASRPVKQYGVGSAWSASQNNKFVEFKYKINTHCTTLNDTAEKVIAWKILADMPVRYSAATGYIETGGYFSTGQLDIKITVDEDGNAVREYTNSQGQVILKKVQAETTTTNLNSTSQWAMTYYVYDEVGNLRFVFPPELSKLLHANDSNVPGATDLANWAFQYKYDARKRMTEKQVPGAGVVYMVYDKRDRLAMTQDGNQRATSTKYWTFTKYDLLNRPILTGIKDTTATLSQSQMQAVVDNFYNKPASKLGEQYVGNVTNHVYGYSNDSYPKYTTAATTELKKFLSVTYYDNYNFRSLWTGNYQYVDENLVTVANGVTLKQADVEFTRVTGKATGSMIKVLDKIAQDGQSWLKAVTYYDDNYRVTQTISDNYKGGIDRSTSLYDFSGKVLKTKSVHTTADINWTATAASAPIGNRLVGTGTSAAWGSSGAVSREVLPASTNGWVEFQGNIGVGSASIKAIGLSDQNTDNTYQTIDYGFYLNWNKALSIYENGTFKTTVSSGYTSDDILKIERTGTTIKYYRNGALVYTSPTASSTQLMVDVALYSTDAEVFNVRSSFTPTTDSLVQRFEYDHAGRLINNWHKVNNAQEVLLTHNDYNELGQLVTKKLHASDAAATDARQAIDYRYNIRGWLTRINHADVNNVSDGGPRDYFGMELGYNDDLNIGTRTLHYNGNISVMKWSANLGLSEISERGYTFSYDAMNRLTAANHKENNNAWTASTSFHEDNLTYDLNGNIKTLNRKGEGGSTMDVLTYRYGTTLSSPVSNKLLAVSDAADKTKGFKEIPNMSSTADDYVYDANGNLVWDKNKGGTEVLKNSLFDAGSTDWTISDPAAKFTFANGEVQVVSGASASLEQVVLEKGRTYIVSIELDKTAGGAVPYLGGTQLTVSNNGMNVITMTCGSVNTIFRLTAGSDFVGKIKSASVKGVSVMSYNHLNLPSLVTQGSDNLQYIYDAAGSKLAQVLSKSNVTSKTTSYSNEYIYENDTLKFINTAEGRVLPGEAVYEYNLKDHLGNVRMTFTSKTPEAIVDSATFELNTQADEQNTFSNYSSMSGQDLVDHTDAGTVYDRVQKLNGGQGSTGRVGLTKSFSVMPGDKIKAEVYAKYQNLSEDGNATSFITALAAAFGTSSGATGEFGKLYTGLNSFAALVPDGDHTDDLETAPKAFVTILLFDKNYNLVDGNWDQIDVSANQIGTDKAIPLHDYMTKEIIASEPGYAMVFLSNEHPTYVDVYFDDFKVTHTPSPVVSVNDYYPFGLTYNSYERESAIKNQYLYNNGAERQDELDLNVDATKFRMYDPTDGRWWQVDPLADQGSLVEWTTYNYSFNNPIRYNDPNGDCPPGTDCGSVLKGVWNSVKSVGEFAVDTYNSGGQNLVQAAENTVAFAELAYAAPEVAGDMIVDNAKESFANRLLETGNAQSAASEMVGEAMGNFLIGAAGDKGFSKLTEAGKGIVYLRSDKTPGGLKDYVGQAKSKERFAARQKEHARANPKADFDFKVIDKGKPGKNLDKKEQKALDARGGPTNKSNPKGGTSNKKNVIKKQDENK